MTLSKRVKLEDKLSVDGNFELDKYQCEAVETILSLNDGELLLIIGPPGTGKTRVVQKASYLLMERGERVLITSHTNRVVDNAIEKLPVEKTLRIGSPEKVLPHLRRYMLNYAMHKHLGGVNIPHLYVRIGLTGETPRTFQDSTYTRKATI